MNAESSRRLFILDTNVLMHDPSCLYRFHEHDVFLPMVVLEELDKGKRGVSEVARNVRQASRFLDEMMTNAGKEDIDRGLPIPGYGSANGGVEHGSLFFQTKNLPVVLPDSLPGKTPDNTILNVALALRDDFPKRDITLISKDINLRIKAAVLGIKAEDYHNDQVLDDVSLLYSGETRLEADFWDNHSKDVESWQEEGRTFYRVNGPDVDSWYTNQCLYIDDGSGFEAMVRRREGADAIIELVDDHRNAKHSVWGITARNREQNFALNMLMDPELDFVTLLGTAGTGKTLLALAAGLAQVLDHGLYREIIMTRVTVPVGEDIGFLPGTEEEKMTPWMGALMDNLEVLTQTEGGDWGRQATDDLLRSRIRIHSLNFMQRLCLLSVVLHKIFNSQYYIQCIHTYYNGSIVSVKYDNF